MTVARLFDVLGWLKWPSLVAVSVLPATSYLFWWSERNPGIGAALYDPAHVAGVPLVLAHRAGADLYGGEAATWFVRSCRDCEVRLAHVRVAYGGCDSPPVQWTVAEGVPGRLSAQLTWSMADTGATGDCIWVDGVAGDGRRDLRMWRLDRAVAR